MATAVSPNSLYAGIGGIVQVRGTSLKGALWVGFGSVRVRPFYVTNSYVWVVAPALRAGQYPITIGTPAGHPSVQGALDYLLATYDPVLGAWPIIPPHDNSRPHAPWWEYSDAFVGNWGRFEPSQTFPAGKGASLEYRFRNGREVEFTAREINVQQLIGDVKKYLAEKKIPVRL